MGKHTINVIGVPVYVCSDCGEQFSRGPDSIIYAKRVREAFEMREREMRF
ncbi:YgiT-type zinc finger protein [Paenibacillus sp. F411]|nr:YgiT-type zinc finger protein [Paenibacillus sp. F411]